ncbi:MAG: transrane protein isoform [Myxococcales bacterium]|nr:transrane protein isoform [Myxococcales bacterium]
MTHILLRRGGLLGIATLALFVWLAPSHVVDGDNSEFSTLSVTGGTAHPSGYPLFVLWLRAMSWLPGASPAHTAAIATAILAAVSILILHAACRAWGARPLAATIACAVFAGGPIVLRTYTEAEVFALNGVVVATVLWLAAEQGPLRGARRAIALGLIAGLGLSNHMTCALLAPVGLLGVVRGVREASRASRSGVAVIGATVLAVLAGLTPYAYLLAAPDTPLSWGKVHDVEELIAMVLRQDYGGPGAFRSTGPEVSPWTSIASLGTDMARGWLWVPLTAGLVTFGWRIVRPKAPEDRWGWSMLATSLLLAGPVLVSRFNVPPEGLGLYVCRRFYLLPMLLAAIPISVAISELGDLLERRIGSRRAVLASVVASTLGLAVVAATSLPAISVVHGPAVENSAHNLLGSLPKDAVVIASQDELHAATGYVQTALGVRQDVTIVTWTIMTLDWYRARMAKRGIVAAPGPGSPLVRVVATLLAKGRPVFVDRLQTEVIASFPTHPYGIVIRVLPPGAPMPSVPEVFTINQQLYAAFVLDEPQPGPDDEYATVVHRRYAGIWQMIGTALAREGKHEDAAWSFETARQLGPRP